MMQKQIIDEIAQHLGVTPQDIDINASLTEDLALGPVELSDLLSNLSTKFEVNFDQNDIEGIRSVGDLVELIEDQSLE